MSTAGLDFWNKNFFKDEVIIRTDISIDKLIGHVGIPNDKKSEKILNEFDYRALTLAYDGYDKVRHHIEKIVWLIQSYAINGWTNPIKICNFFDNDTYLVHPGTNRLIAARFLKCQTMPVLLTINKKQLAYQTITNENVITTEKELRENTFKSNGKVLFRTEGSKPLIIDNKMTQEKRIDWTFEFTDEDAWPVHNEFVAWHNLVFNSFPLNVLASDDIKPNLKNEYMYSIGNTDRREITISDKFDENASGIIVRLKKPVKDVYSLLFFMHPDYYCAKTRDGSIELVNNTVKPSGKTLFIPDHYV